MAKRFSSLVLVLTMSLFLLFGIGVTAFAAGDNESVTAVTSPDPSTFTVVQGTERGDIGLPSTLSATITTSASQEGAENSTHTQDLNVMWTGDYDADTPGTYTLTAAFTDTSLTYDPMPQVVVNVEKKITPSIQLTSLGAENGGVDVTDIKANGTSVMGGQIQVPDATTFTLIVSVGGDASWLNRTIGIKIPKGLRLVSGTGITSVNSNGTYTKKTYTPDEQLVFGANGYPTWAGDSTLTLDSFSLPLTSGTMTYPLLDGVSGTDITLVLQAEPFLYNYSANQSLNTISVSMDGTSSDSLSTSHDEASTTPVLDGNTMSDTTSASVASSIYLDQALPVTVSATGAFNYNANNYTYQDAFDVVYKTGAVIGDIPSGWTMGTAQDNGDGTSTVHISGNSATVATTSNTLTTFTVSYPAAAGFKTGDTPEVKIKNVTWKTVTIDSNNDPYYVTHTATDSSCSTAIVDEPTFAPSYYDDSADTESYNNYDGASVLLASTWYKHGSGRCKTPVSYRYNADPLDNVSELQVAVNAADLRNYVTKITYKLKGESEATWVNDGDYSDMPGVFQSVTYEGNRYYYKAPTGQYLEYLYIDCSQDPWEASTYRGLACKTWGRPVSDAYTGTYSSHTWSTWTDTGSGFNKVAESAGTGFRWKEPVPFVLTVTPNNKSDLYLFDLSEKAGGSLGSVTLKNATNSKTASSLKVDVGVDTARNAVTGITLPYSYVSSDAGTAAQQITHMEWTYTDGTSDSWDSTDGTDAPLTNKTTSSATFTADVDDDTASWVVNKYKHIASFSYTLNGWSASAIASQLVLNGIELGGDTVGTDAYPATYSNNSVVVTELPKGNEVANTAIGHQWSALSNTNGYMKLTGTNVEVNAGESTVLTLTAKNQISYWSQASYLPKICCAIVLPKDVQPSGSVKASMSGKQFGEDTATLTSSRPATDEELAATGMPAGSITYSYSLKNQNAIVGGSYRTSSDSGYLTLSVPVTVNPLAANATYTFNQLAFMGSNLEYTKSGKSYDIGSNNTANVFGIGKTAHVLQASSANTFKINRSPGLYVAESVAGSDGVFKTYSSGDDDTVARFHKDDAGTLRAVLTNTIDPTGVSDPYNYALIPVQKTGNGIQSVDHSFDFTVNGNATATYTEGGVDEASIKYLTLASDAQITSTNVADTFTNAADAYDANTNFVIVRLKNQTPGVTCTIDIPVKAPASVSDAQLYNENYTKTYFVTSGTTRVDYSASANGNMRSSYQNAFWDISFETNGGNTIDSITDIPDGDVATAPADPTKLGYTFAGWYTDAKFKTAFDFSTPITSNMTLYAKWTENPAVTMTYTADTGGSVTPTSEQVLPVTGTPKGSTATANEGYTFSMWCQGDTICGYDATYVPEKAAATGLYEAGTYTAKFTPHVYKIAFNANAASGVTGTMVDQPMTYDVAANLNANGYTRPGYTFTGWNTVADGSGTNYTDQTSAKNLTATNNDSVTLYAQWTANTDTAYKVQYYCQNMAGDGYTQQTFDTVNGVGTTNTDATVDQKFYTGLTYKNTTYEDSANTASGTKLVIAGDGSLVVKLYYDRNIHDVTFNANGHGTAPTGITGARFGSFLTAPTAPTAAGYDFGGWYTDAACTDGNEWNFTDSAIPTGMTDADVILYAKWTPHAYAVTFVNDGVNAAHAGMTGSDKQDIAYGSNAQAGCTVTINTGDTADYMFLGWNYSYTAADGTTKSGTVTDYTTVPVMGDIAFHAVILRVPFISTSATNGLVSILNAADNMTTPTADKDAVENIQIADLPAQAALNFVPLNTVDYTLDTTNSMIVRNFAASPVNKTITASGTYAFPSDASALQLTVDFANGTLRSTKNITTDDSLDIHLNYVPKQTTYTVNHYAMAVDGTYPTTPTTTETSGTVDALTNATFTPKKATDTGFVGTAYDSTLTTYQDVDQTTASTTVTNVRGDGSTVVSLYYPRNAYTVTYNANGHGTAPAAQNNVLYGNTTIAPTAPTVVGYTFGGWYTDNTCSDTSAWDFTKNTVTSDSTLYAKWTPITYTVTFDKNAAKATGTMNNQTMTYDVAAQLTKNGFTRPGYTFTGWNTETGVSYTDEQSVKNLAAEDTSVALYAQWHENSAVDINYATSNGGMVNPAGDQYVAPSSGVATGSTATPDAGYHFVKWTNNTDSTTTTDATLTSTQVDAVAKASGAYVATIFTAHFAENNPVKITYVSADAATGTVNPESESVAPATGTVEGSTAIAKPGYHFVNWTNSVNGDFTTDATLSADQIDSAAKVTGAYAPTTFTAHFAENNPVTMAYATANTVMGSVNPTSQTLAPATGMAAGSTATANPGYHFTNWSNNIDGTTTSDSVLSTEQVDAVAKASGAYVPVAFTAHFAEDDPVTITYVSANAKAGTVDPT
ncbi:MAG: InlB B-repeat-containing protein, partial [Eggerthellaceae bacterium]|nr:InlB B-repeat-containing protein [Eggerthellaceae bacterium]